MSFGDGRSLSHAELERIRRRAVERMLAGESPDAVAAGYELNRSTVYAWRKAYELGGSDALSAKPVPGRPSALTEEIRQDLYTTIKNTDPRAHGWREALWTRGLVRELIERRYELLFTPAYVGKVMRSLGLSPQRPMYRATQQDPARVTAWREVEFPAIRDEAAQVGATIYFGDEASVRSDHHAGTTWAPVGETPVVDATGDRVSVSMVSAIGMRGDLHFEALTGSIDSAVFIEFLKKLMADDGGPVFLILDNSRVHKSKLVKSFVESTEGRLTLFFLPPYSPQLNPDEWVWNNVKTHRIGRSGLMRSAEMFQSVYAALLRLKNSPHIVQGFFRDPTLAYIHQ